MTRKNYALITVFIMLFLFINLQIFQKETIKTDGEIIYFKLRPVDPRAFMLGDYMSLNFEHNLWNSSEDNLQTFVVTLDHQSIVVDSEPYQGNDLHANQRLFTIQDKLRPDRFYFQEGHGKAYDASQYGQFRYRSPNEFLLESLVDADLKAIKDAL